MGFAVGCLKYLVEWSDGPIAVGMATKYSATHNLGEGG